MKTKMLISLLFFCMLSVSAQTNNGTWVPAEIKPSFPGGEAAMKKFINDNLVYPQDALEQGIEGVVYCEFIVTETGALTDLKVYQGLFPSCDEEALRIIRLMPNWIPGQVDQQYRVYDNILPIRFRLPK